MQKKSESKDAPVDFSALVLGFSSAALYYMGMTPVEGKEKGQKNLTLAKQNIDIIDLLHLKTKGNLSAEEANLLAQVRSDLMLRFVESSKA